MAADKKKAEKKTAEKKTTKKVATAKTQPKVGKKETIQVPKGGQVIQYFTLTPTLPSETGRGDWIFATSKAPKVDISELTVRFKLNASPLERALERAVLVVSMNNKKPNVNGTWRFALGGVATDLADEDPSNDVVTEVIDNGFTLIIYVQVLAEKNKEQFPFGFMASFTDATTGIVSIYESQDPGIYPKRP